MATSTSTYVPVPGIYFLFHPDMDGIAQSGRPLFLTECEQATFLELMDSNHLLATRAYMLLRRLHVDDQPVVFVLRTPIRAQDNLVLAIGPFFEEDMIEKMKRLWGEPPEPVILPNDWLQLTVIN